MNNILDKPNDPLDFVNSIRAHSGTPHSTPEALDYNQVQSYKKINNNNHNNKQNSKKKAGKKSPENCSFCKRNVCNILSHARFWLSKYKPNN